MGLKVHGIPERPADAGALAGKVVAIDAPNLLYAFYAVQLLHRAPTPDARAGALASATRGMLQRVRDLADAGARSVVVLDGPPHPRKAAHLLDRNAARSVPTIRPEEHRVVADALRERGIHVVQAPHDAEGQASMMARRGLADVVATTDWDALAMGAPLLLRNLSAHPAKTEGRRWSLVRADEALAALGVTRETLAAAAVLMGCDYFPGFPGVGPKKAVKMLAGRPAEGALVLALDALGVADAAREEARAAFRLLVDPPWREDAHGAPARAARAKTRRLDSFA